VILGAGFDTRAWRLDALADATVFEVDHPDTQALKRARAAALPAKAREVRFVATDFRRDDLAASLRAAGYDESRPAFWLWEGVTMYLRPEAVAANLEALAALSAPGSHLALTYLSKDRGRIPRSVFLALLGEPVRSAYAPAEITDLAKTYGWGCTADSGIRGLAARSGAGAAAYEASSGATVVRADLGGTLNMIEDLLQPRHSADAPFPAGTDRGSHRINRENDGARRQTPFPVKKRWSADIADAIFQPYLKKRS
jgi:O-methyltransferase involved in polyketide biosynthesis